MSIRILQLLLLLLRRLLRLRHLLLSRLVPVVSLGLGSDRWWRQWSITRRTLILVRKEKKVERLWPGVTAAVVPLVVVVVIEGAWEVRHQ